MPLSTRITRKSFLRLLGAAPASAAVGVGLGSCGGGGASEITTPASTVGQSVAPNTNPAITPLAAKAGYAGIGIPGVSYWDGSFAFADLARHGDPRQMNYAAISTDANGNPTQDFLYVVAAFNLAAGAYNIVFQGRATLTATSGTITGYSYNPSTNLSTAIWNAPNGITSGASVLFNNSQKTASSATNTGISGLKIWRPGYPTDGSVTFTREFVTAMQKFQTIRAMDFFATNGNPSVNWSDRTLPSHLGSTGQYGQSWEMLVLLANATDCNIWVNIPANATNAYVNNLALLIKYGSDGVNPYTSVQANPVFPPLNANACVYTEYGNEVWNSAGGFNCFVWALASANTYLSDTTHPIAFDGPNGDQYLALRRWIAFRSASIGLIFKRVFDATASKVRPILAGQSGNGSSFLSNGLLWAEAFYGTPRSGTFWDPLLGASRAINVSDIWYGGGGAAYYDSSSPPDPNAYLTDTQRAPYFAGLPTSLADPFATNIVKDTVWTHAFGLKNVAYEGGPEPGGEATGGATGNTLAPYFNNDPQMAVVMERIHALWDSAGGDEFNYYCYSSSKPWSFVNDLQPNVVADTNTVKLGAIDTITVTQPTPVAFGAIGTGSFNLKSISSVIGSDAASYKLNGTVYRLQGTGVNYVLFPINLSQAGSHSIRLNVPASNSAGAINLWVDGVFAGTVIAPLNSTNSVMQTSTITTALSAGLNVIRLMATSGDIFVSDIVIS